MLLMTFKMALGRITNFVQADLLKTYALLKLLITPVVILLSVNGGSVCQLPNYTNYCPHCLKSRIIYNRYHGE